MSTGSSWASITVQARATLAASAVRVVGNVQAENAASVVLSNESLVGGSVQIKQGASASVTGSTITGDIQYDQNSGALAADGNSVGGSIQIVGNRGASRVNKNTINGNLQCKENTPAPTGAGNVVGGNAEDQCRQMASPTTNPTVPGTPPQLPVAASPQLPTATSPQLPVAAAPTPLVKVKPVSRRGKLRVDVIPDRGSGYWTFQVQRLKRDGTWATYSRTYRTYGRSETSTLNLIRGTYRVLVRPQCGYQGVATGPVALRR